LESLIVVTLYAVFYIIFIVILKLKSQTDNLAKVLNFIILYKYYFKL